MSLIAKEKIWPTIIISVLVLDVIVGFVSMRIATNDPNASVEPDYYHKAITWDSTMAQARQNAALGWSMTPSLGAITAGHDAPLMLVLRDSTGAAVTGAAIEVTAMPVAHADNVVHATLTSQGTDAYTATLPMERAGLWELRVVATRGAERFTADLRMDASPTGVAAVITARPGDAPVAPAKSPTHPAGL